MEDGQDRWNRNQTLKTYELSAPNEVRVRFLPRDLHDGDIFAAKLDGRRLEVASRGIGSGRGPIKAQ